MEAALRWLAAATPGSAELLRLMDATRPGAVTPSSPPSALTWQAGRATATAPAIPAGTGGSKLLIICTCDGTITGFGLANPKLHGERQQVRQALEYQPANRPTPGTAPVTDKGPSGEGFEEFTTSGDLGLVLIRPARKDEKQPQAVPELAAPARRGDHLNPEEPARPRTPRRPGPAGLRARIVQRLLALNAAIWHNWTISAPVKRSLISYDH